MIKVYPPSPVLADCVSCFWSLENSENDITELVYPTGKMQLIFHYRTPFSDESSSGTHRVQPRFALCGQKTSYSHVTATGNSGMIAAVLKPHAASLLFPMPLYEITDCTIDINDVCADTGISEWEFSDCTDDLSRIRLIENFLARKVDTKPTCHHLFTRCCVDEIRKNRGLALPHDSMERFNFSERSLQRIFREHTGLTPKKYADIVRLENSILLLGKRKNMTDICYESGYYDQSHFIRSFRELTGLTPKEFENRL